MATRTSQPRLQFAASETDADLLYSAGLVAPDPFWFLSLGRQSVLVIADFEVGRAKLESRASRVLGSSELVRSQGRLTKSGDPDLRPESVTLALLEEVGASRIEVSPRFPLGLARALEASKIQVEVVPAESDPRRLKKSDVEIKAMESTQRVVERSMAAAEGMLRASSVKKNRLFLGGQALMAEDLRRTIQLTLMEHGCLAGQTIVAHGDQAVDPHDQGSGPLLAGEAVVIDIFPRSLSSHYFADMARTFVKGTPAPQLARMHKTVLAAQKKAMAAIRPGVRIRDVHRLVQAHFDEAGFPTGVVEGRLQGFIHSTGHGLGLEIHEAPRVGAIDPTVRFKQGMVVTVEPGLYYLGLGGVRIEDMVLVTPTGVRNLTRYHKRLVID